jgi:V8-like Glu-specific endopeptidase
VQEDKTVPPQWNPALNVLIDLLAELYPDSDAARLVVMRAGLDTSRINFAGAPKIFWMRIVEEANKHTAMTLALVKIAKEDYPSNVNFDVIEPPLRPLTPLVEPKLQDRDWKGPITLTVNMERIIGDQSTFLPISFLEIGLQRARSVVRVSIPGGAGTGFLTKNNLLVTNNHVISSIEDARRAKIWFNYQKTATGEDAPVEDFMLDPDDGFATSPMDGGDDWTAVRVKGDANARWGTLDLAESSVKVNDFVNIIQHPKGESKKIALYHNIVVFSDNSRVQYLTDTEPGSSGSPVFNSEWQIVALHHSGNERIEPGTNKVFRCNEGIHVNTLVKGLRKSGLI